MKKQLNYQPKSDLVIPLYLKSIITGLLLLVIIPSYAEDCSCTMGKDCIEKKKSVTFSYSVSASDKLYLSNQYGDVKVSFWDKNEVKVDVVVIANASSIERAANYLSTVDIQGKKENGIVSIKTIRDECSYNNNVNRWKSDDDKEEKNYLRIDYQVFMPKSNPLHLKNSFGNSSIPSFTADLKIEQSYGNFTTENINGSNADVKVSFGKAFIKNMNGGKLFLSYSELNANRIDKVSFTNSFGKVDLKELGECQAKLSYCKGIIEKITESAKIKMEFSSSLKIEEVGKNVKELEIYANYSPVLLNLDEINTYEFDIKTSYGSFDYPSEKQISFTRNSQDEARRDNNYTYSSSKSFAGKIGKGTPTTKITVNSTFSSVKFR